MSEFLEARGLPYRASKEKAYSTDANIWGATHEAKDLEFLKNGLNIVQPIMCAKFWDPNVSINSETVRVEFKEGHPVAIRN